MKLLLISSVNLTTNPRVYKELQLASSSNCQVTFLGYKLGNWSDAGDDEIEKLYPFVKFIYLDATRHNYFAWLYHSLLHLASRALWPFIRYSLTLTAIANSKRTVPLMKKAIQLCNHENFDLVISHTLPALYPAFSLQQKCNSKFAFDVEDFHPGEKIFTDAVNEKKRREVIMKELLPYASYISCASPLISKAVEDLAGVQTITVLNYFSKDEFVPPVINITKKVKLVWFSQNINAARGLELVISGWDILKVNFELTLIGKIDKAFYEQELKNHPDIIIQEPVPQKELHRNLSYYDVGLAIDVDTDDYNRKLAITNKILAYYQAGLYIMATDTPAQQDFLATRSEHGIIVKQDSTEVISALEKIFMEKDGIRAAGAGRFLNASGTSWETESLRISSAWQNINSLQNVEKLN